MVCGEIMGLWKKNPPIQHDKIAWHGTALLTEINELNRRLIANTEQTQPKTIDL